MAFLSIYKMIIKINDSVFTEIIENNFLLTWQRFISTIIRTAEQGHHLFIINPEMLHYIIESDKISDYSKYILKEITRRSFYTFEELDGRQTFSFTVNKSETEFEIDILTTQAFEIDKLLQPSEIILEDIEDNVIYNQILISYIKHQGITAHFYYRPLNGGGDGSSRLVATHYRYNKNIHAIFDTDKKHPNDNIGKTARKIIEEFSKIGLNNNYHILDCHEVENLHPIQSFKEKADQHQSKTVLFIEHAISINESTYKFFDFKQSHKFCDIFNNESDFAKFWRDIYNTCNIEGVDINSFKSDPQKHKHTITPKLSTVVGLLKDDMAKGVCKHTKIEEIFPKQLQETWKEIGKNASLDICSTTD